MKLSRLSKPILTRPVLLPICFTLPLELKSFQMISQKTSKLWSAISVIPQTSTTPVNWNPRRKILLINPAFESIISLQQCHEWVALVHPFLLFIILRSTYLDCFGSSLHWTCWERRRQESQVYQISIYKKAFFTLLCGSILDVFLYFVVSFPFCVGFRWFLLLRTYIKMCFSLWWMLVIFYWYHQADTGGIYCLIMHGGETTESSYVPEAARQFNIF